MILAHIYIMTSCILRTDSTSSTKVLQKIFLKKVQYVKMITNRVKIPIVTRLRNFLVRVLTKGGDIRGMTNGVAITREPADTCRRVTLAKMHTFGVFLPCSVWEDECTRTGCAFCKSLCHRYSTRLWLGAHLFGISLRRCL